MNYIGSKKKLLAAIQSLVEVHHLGTGKMADIFTGTGSVAHYFASHGYQVLANDWQQYSSQIVSQRLNAPTIQDLTEISECLNLNQAESVPARMGQILEYLDSIPLCSGLFFQEYCEGGQAKRLYFSRQNGLKIQTVRDKIQRWASEGIIGETLESYLVAILIRSADRVANTASVYGAYLKKIKASANQSWQWVVPKESVARNGHQVLNLDVFDVIPLLKDFKPDFVYIDPPYNTRQYSANYHLLETISRWDLNEFTPRGKTGLRPASQNRSPFSLNRQVKTSFSILINDLQPFPIILSYNNEGIVPISYLEATLVNCYDTVKIMPVKHHRFRSDMNNNNRHYKADSTTEYLIMAK